MSQIPLHKNPIFFLPKTPYYIFFSFSIYTKYDVQYMHIVDDDEEEEEKKKNNS